MTTLEEAIIYATIMHQGRNRKFRKKPFILHPLEVAQILSTLTDDEEVLAAGILHDIVEDTSGTLGGIESRFGKRVADLVASVSETDDPNKNERDTWKQRKEESLDVLKNSTDIGVKMLTLADKLANIRSIAAVYSEKGDDLWQDLHQKDPAMQLWFYKTTAEILEYSYNKTGAFKEFIKHINFVWPGTFDSEKSRYRKYREVSVDGCEMIGHGAKGEVYRYNDELVIKVFNQNNTYHDVEQEIAVSRKAFILGIPTAISFGIVSVGDRYGAMYELLDAETISRLIARSPGRLDHYAAIMADLAHTIHDTRVTDEDKFPEATGRLMDYIDGGVGLEDKILAQKCRRLLEALPAPTNLIHGDFHTNNVFQQHGELLLIDMDRMSRGHPIAEISDLFYFYVLRGEDDPTVVEQFMGFSYQNAKAFFHMFLAHYLDTEDLDRIFDVTRKASLLGYTRTIRMIRKKSTLTKQDEEKIGQCIQRIGKLVGELDSLEF